MRTTLPPERLAELAAQGRAQAARSPFVNPHTVANATKLLRERGEAWASSVLMRPLERRALIGPQYPWLEEGEMETLVLADAAEWVQLEDAARP
jgi:hypothetical protein